MGGVTHGEGCEVETGRVAFATADSCKGHLVTSDPSDTYTVQFVVVLL